MVDLLLFLQSMRQFHRGMGMALPAGVQQLILHAK
jgi:hypothetical protein